MTFVDSAGRSGSASSSVLGGSNFRSYRLDFVDFSGNVDFSDINAIEFEVQSFDNVDFEVDSIASYGDVPVVIETDCITGVVLPCDTDYYRLQEFDTVQVGDYLSISYEDIDAVDQLTATNGHFYVIASQFDNLQEELASNENIIDTLGHLPGPDNYEYRCAGNCDIEIVWSQLENATYYLAVEGNGDDNLVYQICLEYRSVPVVELTDGVPQTTLFERRPTFPPTDNALHYSYYFIDIPEASFSEGTYLRSEDVV